MPCSSLNIFASPKCKFPVAGTNTFYINWLSKMCSVLFGKDVMNNGNVISFGPHVSTTQYPFVKMLQNVGVFVMFQMIFNC